MVVALGDGAQKVCPVPAQERSASAPPTPEHPLGAPRACSPGEFLEIRNEGLAAADRKGASQSHSDAWMPGTQVQASPLLPGEPDAADAAAAPQPSSAIGTARAGGAAFSFDIPLEEVLAVATEAFGQIAASLPSPKWDRRVQALKGVGSILRGVGLTAVPQRENCRGLQQRDQTRCFRAACLILHTAMRDKVLPVLLAAHQLYCLAFERGLGAVSQDEARMAMATLVPHLLAKLGDLNIRLHESACTTVVFSAGQPFFGLSAALARLHSHLEETSARGVQRVRVQAGVLDVVGRLVRRFPGRRPGEGDESDAVATWTAADVRPFIVAGAVVDGVTGSRVQQAAAGLAVAVCETLGRAALEPVLDGMSLAAKEIIISRLNDEALEEEDGDDVDDGAADLPDGLCIVGVALHQPKGKAAGGVDVCLTSQKEECIMDEILEETGLVFEGKDLKKASKVNSLLDEDLHGLGLEGVDDWEQSDTSMLLA